MPDTSKKESKEKWWEASLLQNPVICIDPETAQLVRRQVYFDEKTGEMKARMEMKPYKSYFAFRMQGTDGEAYIPLSEFEIASYYRSGAYGFPKEIFQTISHYEKDGSADALYEIATIFRTDETLLDENTYVEYLVKAADMGSEGARIELSLRYCLSEETSVRNKGKKLLDGLIDERSAAGYYVFGYLIESGILERDAEKAF